MDVSDSNSEENETRIPVPSSVPSNGAALDFHSYKCFTDIESRWSIEYNYEGNINIRKWSYDDELDLRVRMRFADKQQAVYAVK